MIRKVVAFLILMGAGFGVMHFIVGWENFATIRSDSGKPIKELESGTSGIVVDQIGDNAKDVVEFSFSGALEIPRRREVKLPSGARRRLKTYLLKAEDSRQLPNADGSVELSDVEVQFFDIDESDPANPQSEHAGTLFATIAILQVGRDSEGRPSIQEDRDMDLRDVVVESNPDSKLGQVEMRIPRVLLRHTKLGLALRTPDPRESFEVVVGGDDPMRLIGEGLQAVLPSDDMPAGHKRTLEFHVAANPVFVRGESTLQAEGPLDYVEDMTTGIGEVELRDNVSADGLLKNRGGSAVIARGDRIHGVLARSERRIGGRTKRSGSWVELHFFGSPARLTGDGAVLHCERIDALPSIDGEPFAFTANGKPWLEQSDRGLRFDANRIHLIRLPEYLGALHRPFGFTDRFGSLVHELMVFEGVSTVRDDTRGTSVRSERGIRVLRGKGEGAASVSIGVGSVTVERDGLMASGNDGFELVQAADGAQFMRLGPDPANAGHEFSIERGGARPIRVVGHGRCEVDQLSDGGRRITLESPIKDLRAELQGSVLTGADRIAAVIDADGELVGFDAFGEECRIERATDDGLVVGTAQSLHAVPGGGGFRLLGTPATVRQPGKDSVVLGDEIRVYPYGTSKNAVVVLRGPERRAHVTVVPPEPAAGKRSSTAPHDPIGVDADRVRFLPFLVSDSVLRFHTGGRLRSWDIGFAAAMRTEHVFATGEIDIEQEGEREFHATGDAFITGLDAAAGVLYGAPGRVVHRTKDGRRITAIANSIQVGRSSTGGEDLRLMFDTEREPVIEVRTETEDANLRNFRVTCAGDIRSVDGRMEFAAPVAVRELDQEGDPDPLGMQLDAEGMRTTSDSQGRLTEIVAFGEAVMSVSGVRAVGDEMTVDVQRSWATIMRHRGFAEVKMPSGRVVRGQRLEVDFVNGLFSGWNIRIH